MIHDRFAACWLALGLALPVLAAAQPARPAQPGATLPPFASEADLEAFLEPMTAPRRAALAEQQRREEEARRLHEEARRQWEAANPGKTYAPPPVPQPTAVASPMLESVQVTGSKAGAITNNQSAGVDEGGIVKLHGKHLVVLRRGRLFTIDVDRHTLKPVSSIDAQAPGLDSRGTWIDEMLVADDTIAVIGYSYPRGGTEVSLFNIDDDGRLSYRSTWHLRSNDYYSARNYASRLVGGKLVFYTPVQLTPWRDLAEQWPAFRRWSGDGRQPFERIALATRLYRHGDVPDKQRGITLHTVVSCDVKQAEPSCQASAVFGPASRVFYVSSNAVYVWTAPFTPRDQPLPSTPVASLYRMPLDGSAPSALKVVGRPIDQFSFLEQDGHLNLLLRDSAGPGGDAMWNAEFSASSNGLKLLRAPISDFGAGEDLPDLGRYRALPALSRDGCSLQNRFVGAYLLYGSGCVWGPTGDDNAALNAVPFAAPQLPVAQLKLNHGADRIEAMGDDAVVIGARKTELVFSALRLSRGTPQFAGRYAQANASQAETRSHGFFYKAETAETGLIGLPLRGGGEPGHRQLWQGSTALLYLRNDRLRMTPVGRLAAQPPGGDDGCRISCVDWYGNARPIFLGDRVFALMGYELVEGRVLKRAGVEALVELRRVSFQPRRGD